MLQESFHTEIGKCGSEKYRSELSASDLFKVKFISGALQAITSADLMIVAGTSLTVYPAAGLVRYFRGGPLVLINRDATPMDSECDLVIHDKVGEVLGALA